MKELTVQPGSSSRAILKNEGITSNLDQISRENNYKLVVHMIEHS